MHNSLLSGICLALAGLGAAASSEPEFIETAPVVPRDISLSFPWEYSKEDQPLFDLTLNDGDGDAFDLKVECLECSTSGKVLVDFQKGSFLDIRDSVANLTFSGASAYIDLSVYVGASGTHSINIINLGGLGDDIDIGMNIYLDLIFDFDAHIVAEGGFKLSIPDGSWIAFDLANTIQGYNFAGTSVSKIPWQVTSGAAKMTVDLRLRAEVGVKAELFGFGFALDAGMWLNLIEVIATLDSTSACSLESTETWDINAAVYANEVVIIDSSSYGPSPTASSTLYTGTTLTQCWESVATTNAATMKAAMVMPTTAPGAIDAALPNTPIAALKFSTLPVSEAVSVLANTSVTASKPPRIPVSEVASVLPNATVSLTYPKTTTFSPPASISPKVSGKLWNITVSPALHTTTVHSTTVYTITSCAAAVINCPGKWAQEIVVTKTVDLYTTICPVTETQSVPVATTTSRTPRKLVVSDGIILSACPTPIVGIFTSPKGVNPPAEHTTTIHSFATNAVEFMKATTVSVPVISTPTQTVSAFYKNSTFTKTIVNNIPHTAAPTGPAGNTTMLELKHTSVSQMSASPATQKSTFAKVSTVTALVGLLIAFQTL